MIQEYFERLKEVLEVTGEVRQIDLEYCKLLTEQSKAELLKTNEQESEKDRAIQLLQTRASVFRKIKHHSYEEKECIKAIQIIKMLIPEV